MTTPVPEWLTALRGANTPPQLTDPVAVDGPDELVGAICRAVPMDGQGDRALVLVVASDPERGMHTVLLLSPDVPLATANDVLLTGSATGLPYELLAQTDVFGYLWHAQLDSTVARLPEALSSQLLTRATDVAAGPALKAERDPRWGYKLAELARIQALTGSCTGQLVDGEPHLLVDPVSLIPGNDDVLELEEFVLALADAVQACDTEVPAWVLEALLADVRVTGAYLDAGADIALRLLSELWERALSNMPSQNEPATPPEALVWRRTSLLRNDAPPGGSHSLRDRLIAGEFDHGHGCVRMMSRLQTTNGDGMSIAEIGGRLVQCLTEGTRP
jgi:hypothetical protein